MLEGCKIHVQRDNERAEDVLPGEEKALGRPHSGHPVPKGGYKKACSLMGSVLIGQGVMVLS